MSQTDENWQCPNCGSDDPHNELSVMYDEIEVDVTCESVYFTFNDESDDPGMAFTHGEFERIIDHYRQSVPEQTIIVDDETLERVRNDTEVRTYHFDHAPSVTLVNERDKKKWEQHDRPEQAGTVIFLDEDLFNRIKHSVSGVKLSGVHIVHEGKKHTALDDSYDHHIGTDSLSDVDDHSTHE